MKPQPHPEVLNPQPKALIVGWGHVGQQIGRYFTGAHRVDLDAVIRFQTGIAVQHIPACYDIGFFCVPTPPLGGGGCDLSYLQTAMLSWRGKAHFWCVKSTIPVGTLAEGGWYTSMCFSPEFYGETLGHPLAGICVDPFIILGGSHAVTRVFAEAWSLVTNSNARIFQTDSTTAELVKLMENSWLATKVSFCNQFYDLALLAGVDWNELRELWLLDPRVGRSHTYVYPENRGFAGKCLPKDIANLCHWARQHGEPAAFMESVLEYNSKVRK